MRFSDVVLRRGHLSEDALADVWMTGHRPAHLDSCKRCDRLANEMGAWLGDVRATGLALGDEQFPAERPAAQHAQILRKLEQVDHPARVISFPKQARPEALRRHKIRIAPAWVGVAAAAGIVLGVVGEQLTIQLSQHATGTAQTTPSPELTALQLAPLPAPTASISDADLLETDLTQSHSQTLGAIESLTPTPAMVVSRK